LNPEQAEEETLALRPIPRSVKSAVPEAAAPARGPAAPTAAAALPRQGRRPARFFEDLPSAPVEPDAEPAGGVLQAKLAPDGMDEAAAAPALAASVAAARIGGQGLPPTLHAPMAQALAARFDDVRVHDDARADHLTRLLGARAVTMGPDLFFRRGEYRPDTRGGRELVGHELTHVVQQRRGRAHCPPGAEAAVLDDAGLEGEADRLGRQAAELPDGAPGAVPDRVAPAPAPAGGAPTLQRKIDYSTSYRKQSAETKEALIALLIARYGRLNAGYITEQINVIEADKSRWSMKEIIVAFNKARERGELRAHSEVVFPSSASAVQPHSIDDYAFNSVTWLDGAIGAFKFDPIRNDTGADAHAEELFIKRVDEAQTRGDVDLAANPRVRITLNNSPCDQKCAGILAGWTQINHLTKVTIHFANPYGTETEFQQAIATLKAAGIRVHGFDLSPFLTGVDVRENTVSRGTLMVEKLRLAKEHELYTSDEESDGE
jgi:Domain of unknown function (DUF4157)/Secreted Novel AID/APOBEC-like Deaminase 4